MDFAGSKLDDVFQFPPECFSNNQTTDEPPNVSASPGCDFTLDEVRRLLDPSANAQFDIALLPAWRAVVLVLYVLVIVFGALGNTLVVVTIAKTKQLWTATNIFIANLAVADIFVCVFDLPLSLYYLLAGNWVFGKILCHVIMMVFGLVVYTSTLTLTMIAVDRYVLIVHPLTTRITVSQALVITVLIAVVALVVATPIAVFSRYFVFTDESLDIHRQLCREEWPGNQKKIYTILTTFFQFFLPLLVILCLYSLIFRNLRQKVQRRRSKKTKTTKMLVAVVSVFALTWSPFHLHAILFEFDYSLIPGRYMRLIDMLLKVFALSSSCINPLLYGWMNDNYRKAFLSIIRRPTHTPTGLHREDSDGSGRSRHSNRSKPMNSALTYTTVDIQCEPISHRGDEPTEVDEGHLKDNSVPEKNGCYGGTRDV